MRITAEVLTTETGESASQTTTVDTRSPGIPHSDRREETIFGCPRSAGLAVHDVATREKHAAQTIGIHNDTLIHEALFHRYKSLHPLHHAKLDRDLHQNLREKAGNKRFVASVQIRV